MKGPDRRRGDVLSARGADAVVDKPARLHDIRLLRRHQYSEGQFRKELTERESAEMVRRRFALWAAE